MDLAIIGGSDGPTAIFLFSTFDWIVFLGVIIVLAGVAFVFWKK